MRRMKLRRAWLITKIVIIVLVIYAAVTLISTKSKIETMEQRKDDLQQQVTDKTITNAALTYEIEHKGDDDTIADIAREQLGLVSPGEIVFYDSGK